MSVTSRRLAATRTAGAVLFVALGVASLGATAGHHLAHPRGHEADGIVDTTNCGVQCVPDLSSPQNQQGQTGHPGLPPKPTIP
jgi:hypothetical protein